MINDKTTTHKHFGNKREDIFDYGICTSLLYNHINDFKVDKEWTMNSGRLQYRSIFKIQKLKEHTYHLKIKNWT